MVWSQYVYEATTDLDSYASDEDDSIDNTPLNIEDWEVQYSDELWHMWNTMRTLLEDAGITHRGQFCDFVEFCYMEHEPSYERVIWEYEEQSKWFEERLSHVWRNIRRIVNDNGLHEEMMRGANVYNFTDFAKNYMHVY
jgi:hypothetical protein